MSRFHQFPPNTTSFKNRQKKLVTISVLVKKQEELKGVLEATPARVNSALLYLQNSDRLVRMFTASKPPTGKDAEKTDEYALKFFKKKISEMPALDVTIIQQVITLVMTGLSSNMTLKIGSNPGKGDKNVAGQVTLKDASAHAQGSKTEAISQMTRNKYFSGTIKIDTATFMNKDRGVHTLIHEATHKYAATSDFVYLDREGQITPAADYVDGDEFDVLYSIHNADSYAHFICCTGC